MCFLMHLGHCLLYQLRYSVAWTQFFSKLHYSVNSNVHIRSFSGLYFPAFGLNTYQKNPECGKFPGSVAIYIYIKDILILRWNTAVKAKSNILFQESFLRQHQGWQENSMINKFWILPCRYYLNWSQLELEFTMT